MNYFQVADKINQLHQLDFAERALLNQITSYHFNEKPFFATNEYLSEYWGVSVRSITRYISKLSKLGFIEIETKKKKHEAGSGQWYNKRYILPIVSSILEPKDTVEQVVDIIQLPEPVLTLEKPSEVTTCEDYEPFMGVFPEQENEYSRLMDEAMKITPTKPNEYLYEAVLELIESDSNLYEHVERVRAKKVTIDEKYISGLFEFHISKSDSLMEKYRAIISKLAVA